ncbi:Dps family protein [Paraflavitalea speifideaquila]|uniref:Dps family protein n=1 Tax=Paraflavitalea speifideaquila TaxID=3076558 RepID=UPI0028E1EE91|nr:Dps family protein [Paraflavitalea speifideiaquila]
MKANIGLTEKNAQQIALTLNKILADEQILYAKTRNYHWNYEGDNFMEMHKFYEGQYEELADVVDDVAERIRTLGHFAEGRLKEYLKLADLEEQAPTPDQQKQVRNLLDDHETMTRYIREQINIIQDKLKDAGTADFLTGLMEKHEKDGLDAALLSEVNTPWRGDTFLLRRKRKVSPLELQPKGGNTFPLQRKRKVSPLELQPKRR